MSDTEVNNEVNGDEELNGIEGPPGPPPPASKPAKPRKKPRLERYLEYIVKIKASDLHFKSDQRAHVRTKGDLRPLKEPPLTAEQVRDIWYEVLNEHQRNLLETKGASDFAYQLGGSDRFRVNLFMQRGVLSAAVRRVNKDILNFEELYLPPQINQITEYHQGLVLLAGITGSGKSTTIAAALDYINRKRRCHIVTIEDPIEYLFTDRKALINQREVGVDVDSFPDALKYLMREDPDVVLIGEMRDEETFMAALNASETGHLVFGTVHASSSSQTINRVLDLLPESSRDLVRQTMVFNLKAIVCQKLLKSIREDVPRIPAVEIMYVNSTIQKLIDEQRDDEINKVIRASGPEGMLDMNECLRDLVEREFIDTDVAYAASPNAQELKMRLKGIDSGSASAILG